MNTFGHFISQQRKALRLTQSDVAGLLSVSPTLLNDLENDRRDPRKDDLLPRLAEVLQVQLAELTGLASAHVEHQRVRKQIEDDEFRSLAAYRLSRE